MCNDTKGTIYRVYHDSNPSKTKTLTACQVGLSDHDSNPSQTMTLNAGPVGRVPLPNQRILHV